MCGSTGCYFNITFILKLLKCTNNIPFVTLIEGALDLLEKVAVPLCQIRQVLIWLLIVIIEALDIGLRRNDLLIKIRIKIRENILITELLDQDWCHSNRDLVLNTIFLEIVQGIQKRDV